MGKAENSEDAHTALLGSNAGQALVAIVVFVMSIWIVGPNLPTSPARDTVDILWEPALDAGLDQFWSVFSPNPRDQALAVVAVLEFDDGTITEWTVPEFDPVTGPLRGYRWRKWQERVRLDDNQRYWDSSAEWIANNNQRDGQVATTVRLLRRWTDIEPLTADGIVHNAEQEFEFYVWTRS